MKSFISASALVAVALFFGSVAPVSAVEARTMSAKQVRELVTNAKTPADHLKLAAYYNGEAIKLDVEAKDHEGLVDLYKKHPAVLGSKSNVPMSGSAMHCTNIATSLRDAAKGERELAAGHEQMAKDAGK